ncbi:MAG: ferrous iron transport protein A [Verrucomicrobia bacterium]|nr:ferrous iron transport protein A [Verrucomicrobiota bacterium]
MTTLFHNQPAPPCGAPALCPLNQARVGSRLRVRKLNGPPETSQRLREIGFAEDQQVSLVSCQQSVICMVCNARLALSPELAETILVETMSPSTVCVA